MQGKDLLGIADNIQKSAEKSIGGKFETVVALDDFAYKNHFKVWVLFFLNYTNLSVYSKR